SLDDPLGVRLDVHPYAGSAVRLLRRFAAARAADALGHRRLRGRGEEALGFGTCLLGSTELAKRENAGGETLFLQQAVLELFAVLVEGCQRAFRAAFAEVGLGLAQ